MLYDHIYGYGSLVGPYNSLDCRCFITVLGRPHRRVLRCHHGMCQYLERIYYNALPGMTSIMDMIVAGTRYCIYLSLHGQGYIPAQVLHRTCYMDSFLSSLKLDFVTYFKLVFWFEGNSFCLCGLIKDCLQSFWQ